MCVVVLLDDCIGAEGELDNITEIWLWHSYVKMSKVTQPPV